jgi:hypothetical protein
MRRRELKQAVLAALGMADLSEVFAKLDHFNERDLISPLFSALCNPDETIRWHAVSAFGHVVPRLAQQDLEAARIVMRRFLWSLNDESGGIGWGAPEAMAEIVLHQEILAGEYLHMLVSYMQEDGPECFQDGNYIELPMLQRGLLWGIGRLIPRYRRKIKEMGVVSSLEPYLFSPDGDVRGLAVRCLGLFDAVAPIRQAVQLGNDGHQLRLYSDEGISTFSVADLVRQALDRGEERL